MIRRHHWSLVMMMKKALGLAVLMVGGALTGAHADTFVIEADKAGHEATIVIPAGAVTQLSADRAEPLEGYAGSQIEAMRLSGDVSIGIAGRSQPIEIKADTVVVELTADAAPGPEKRDRTDSAANKVLRSTSTATSFGDHFQLFVGNVVFDLQTASGPMEIKADRVQHQLTSRPGV
jgi:hypothetical protein